MKKLKLIIIILIPLLLTTLFFIKKKNTTKREVKKITKEEIIISSELKLELQKKQEEKKISEKKYVGIKGDIKAVEFLNVEQTVGIIDYKKDIYPEVKVKLLDDSGIYRVRLLIYYKNKQIGYLQENPNTQNKNVELSFILGYRVILDELKTFKDYEGGEISYKIIVWDNNMNEKELKSSKNIKIIDNTKPKSGEVYWSYFYNQDEEDIEMYNKSKINMFQVYKAIELPKLEENALEKYQYLIKDFDENLIIRVGFPLFEKRRKNIEVNIKDDGKYKFYIRAYDKNKNYSEKFVKFYIDRTAPTGRIRLKKDTYHSKEEMIFSIEAKDNLAGIFRMRLAKTKKELYDKKWIDFDKNPKYKAFYKSGIHDLWCQLEDGAFNNSKPFKVSYFVRRKTTIDIRSKQDEKEMKIGIDKRSYERGKIDVKSKEER